MNRPIESPYKPLFFLGTVHALIGIWIWIFFQLGDFYYPGLVHSYLMILGFIFSMATGFLMTAIPKFMQAHECRLWELVVAICLCLSPVAILFYPTSTALPATIAIVQCLWIAAFGLQRFRQRAFDPPPSFIFLPIALISGIVGGVQLLLGSSLAGRALLLEGSVLALILGVGGKLLTTLLGWEKPLNEQLQERRQKIWNRPHFLYRAEAMLFLVGIGLHALGQTQIGDWLWFFVIASLGIRRWNVFRLPKNRGALGIFLWLSIWFTIIGRLSLPIFLAYRMHLAHLVYISGIALMTFLVASRVILAHGGYSLQLELKSKALWTLGVCFALAAVTRVSVPYFEADSYFSHLAYAAGIFSLGVLVWISTFLKRVLHDQIVIEKSR